MAVSLAHSTHYALVRSRTRFRCNDEGGVCNSAAHLTKLMRVGENGMRYKPVRSGLESYPHLLLNPRGIRKARRKERSFDGKPTLHAPGCGSVARTAEEKLIKVHPVTIWLFDRNEVWYCERCLT